jgi:hypothetical protein
VGWEARIVGAGLADQLSVVAISDRQNPPVPDCGISEVIGGAIGLVNDGDLGEPGATLAPLWGWDYGGIGG